MNCVTSYEESERAEARYLRDLRRRGKAARAVVATTRGLAEILANDWQKAAQFYAHHGITEAMLRWEVPSGGDADPGS